MGGEYLVWESKENFRGLRDFRGFRVIDLATSHRILNLETLFKYPFR